ncbi:hypothetical protein D3C72_2182890 [compost metagenome]
MAGNPTQEQEGTHAQAPDAGEATTVIAAARHEQAGNDGAGPLPAQDVLLVRRAHDLPLVVHGSNPPVLV